MRRFIKLVSTFAALLSIASSALSQTGLESAKEKFQTCMFCHSAQTSSVPGIDNQRPKYIVSQLLAYKTGVRVMAAYWSASPEVRQLGNMTMRDQAARLTEEEMQAIAKMFAERPLTRNSWRLNAQSVRAGLALSAQAGCASCHGADFRGVDSVPGLASQSPEYLARQMVGMRAGRRQHPEDAILKTLTEKQAVDLAQYFASIP